MTSRQLYDGVQIELNKENAPNILLEDFNYFANKAINNYVNKRYNIYDINQQTTDDLRVLKATAMLKPHKIKDYTGLTMAGDDNMATYEVIMPSDYLHILNCICVYDVKKTYKCYNKGDTWRAPATRLTADMYSQVLDNFWNKPTYKRPYYYIHNVNTSVTIPTNPYHETNHTHNDDYVFLQNSGSSYLYMRYNGEIYYFEHGDISDGITLGPGPFYLTYSNGLNFAGGSSDTAPVREANKGSFTYEDNKITITPGGYTFEVGAKLNINTVDDVLKNSVSGITIGTDAKNTTNINDNRGNNYSEDTYGTDAFGADIVQGEGLPRTIKITDSDGNITEASNIERGQALRYGNVSQVRLEIRYGTDTQVFALRSVYVDYIKAPQNIRLTQKELDLTEDTSQMLEYPDYVCQEIINELVHILMENIGDPKLQTHPVVNQSIANPAQQQAQDAAGQSA